MTLKTKTRQESQKIFNFNYWQKPCLCVAYNWQGKPYHFQCQSYCKTSLLTFCLNLTPEDKENLTVQFLTIRKAKNPFSIIRALQNICYLATLTYHLSFSIGSLLPSSFFKPGWLDIRLTLWGRGEGSFQEDKCDFLALLPSVIYCLGSWHLLRWWHERRKVKKQSF